LIGYDKNRCLRKKKKAASPLAIEKAFLPFFWRGAVAVSWSRFGQVFFAVKVQLQGFSLGLTN
jgi:hypothetical protein